ncbi:NUDIX hydrolase [Desulfopila inferna]|uniref:NUDIX hydrolase n=1 Tax=Desulfopila inferna TaxID=468528 RepID=UPI001962A572|nr:8-oxo-dGTP diphosphatase [Desulfopila inferna]MBM9605239.1 8-oxo-dGTP diphosphatase [Desulfopila inferna]
MYTPILATLGFILSPDEKMTLLVHRNKRRDDYHFGKFNGLGGKLEPGEDIVSCLKREIREEAGIEANNVILRGTVNWSGFGGEGEDWFGFIFLVKNYDGSPYTSNNEGELMWQEVSRLSSLPMWEGDRFFLPLVFDGDPRVFHGSMPYADGKPRSWQYSRI